jgi:hypothetical protein
LKPSSRESPWNHRAVQKWLVKNVPDSVQGPKAAIVVDDFGILKQGRHSVGVYRQSSGALGKTGDCQVAVNVTYAAPGSKRNNELYRPNAWVEDDEHADLRDQVQHAPHARQAQVGVNPVGIGCRTDRRRTVGQHAPRRTFGPELV